MDGWNEIVSFRYARQATKFFVRIEEKRCEKERKPKYALQFLYT